MRHAVSRELHRYWDGLRAGRTAPERRAVDPADIRNILAYTFVLGVSQSAMTGGRTISFRLSGTRLNALFQRELRASDFLSIWAREHASSVAAMLDVALDDRAAAVGSVRGSPAGCDPIDLELLLLPLRHHGRTHARLLGSLAASANAGWMGLLPVEPLALRSFRAVIGPRSHDGTVAPHPRPFAPPALVAPWQGGGIQVGPFRVYDGGLRRDAPGGPI